MSNQGYIMLSYNWDHQTIVKRIDDGLIANGYKTWIDIRDMDESMDSAMANAVRDATVVLACLSKKYEESGNCKEEGRCIQHFKKPFIPLLMEDYSLNDWVAGIFSRHIYVDFSNEATFDEKFDDLLKRLKKYPNLKPQGRNANPPITPSTESPALTNPDIQHTSSDTPHTSSDTPNTSSDTPHTSSDTPHTSSDTPNTEEPDRMPEISESNFMLVNSAVSKWYDQHKCLDMLKVLFRDMVGSLKLPNITHTMELLGELVAHDYLSRKDLSLLYDTINITKQFALQRKITEVLPSFPDVRDIPISKVTPHRQKLMKLGMELTPSCVGKIDGVYNQPLQVYTDSWSLIKDLEDRLEISEDELTSFIGKLEFLKLPRALKALTEDIIPSSSRKRKHLHSQDEPKVKNAKFW